MFCWLLHECGFDSCQEPAEKPHTGETSSRWVSEDLGHRHGADEWVCSGRAPCSSLWCRQGRTRAVNKPWLSCTSWSDGDGKAMHILGGAGLHSPFLEKTFDTNLTLRFFFFHFQSCFPTMSFVGLKSMSMTLMSLYIHPIFWIVMLFYKTLYSLWAS